MSKTGTPWELTQWLHYQPQDKIFTVTEKRNKRSLTANAYYWVLVNKLAAKLRYSDTEVHFQMLRDYGVCDVFTLLESVPCKDYFKYFEIFASGEMNGKTYNHVRVFKGSSKMNTAEFSRLLEGIRHECEIQGIDVLTPSEVNRLEFIENYGEE